MKTKNTIELSKFITKDRSPEFDADVYVDVSLKGFFLILKYMWYTKINKGEVYLKSEKLYFKENIPSFVKSLVYTIDNVNIENTGEIDITTHNININGQILSNTETNNFIYRVLDISKNQFSNSDKNTI